MFDLLCCIHHAGYENVVRPALDETLACRLVGEKTGLLYRLCERSADAMLILQDGIFVDCNQAAVDLLGCATKADVLALRPADLSPPTQLDGQSSIARQNELIREALTNGNARFEWMHRRRDGSTFVVDVLLTVLSEEPSSLLCVAWRDITERWRREMALQQQLELQSILTTLATHFINLPTDEIDLALQEALQTIGEFAEADRSYVFIYAEAQATMRYLYEWCADGIEPQLSRLQDVPVDALAWSNAKLLAHEMVNIPCVADLPPEAATEKAEFQSQGIQSLIAVPMAVDNTVIGFLGVDAVREPRNWSSNIADLLKVAGSIFVNVIQQKRTLLALHEQHDELAQKVETRTREIERRRRVAESLRETLTVLNSDRPLSQVLQHIVCQAKAVTDASACVLHRVDFEERLIILEATCGWLDELDNHRQVSLDSAGGRQYLSMVERRQPSYGNYPVGGPEVVRHDPQLDPETRRRRILIRSHYAGSLGIPLRIGDQLFGSLIFYYHTPQAFSTEQVSLAVAFVEQAALAIENAHLRNQVEQVAASAERDRLARDLHDSVTQMLFSAGLIAEVLPRLWEQNPDEGRLHLQELRLLTKGALAERRTLLLELRPQALTHAPLEDALGHLVNAVIGRTGIPVVLSVTGSGDLSDEVKVAFYRIVQEAFNNIAKHADASKVDLILVYTLQGARLCIHDDGCGFEKDAVPADHLGLSIMAERASSIDASLYIDSQPGQGTQIVLEWSGKDG